jgi:hypothetical protein
MRLSRIELRKPPARRSSRNVPERRTKVEDGRGDSAVVLMPAALG